MESQTAVKASSSSSVQLNEKINSTKRKTDKLSIRKDPYEIEREEFDKYINKAKQEINNFIQLIREVLQGSLKVESIEPFDIEILDIHWRGIVEDVNDANITYKRLLVDEQTELEGELDDFIRESTCPVAELMISDEYPSLSDDLKALGKEQMNWLMRDSSSESGADSEDVGMVLD